MRKGAAPSLVIIVVRPHRHRFEMVGAWHGCHIVVSKWRVECVVVAPFFIFLVVVGGGGGCAQSWCCSSIHRNLLKIS